MGDKIRIWHHSFTVLQNLPAYAEAMAAHLARIIYRMLTYGREWVDRGAAEHEKRRAERDKQALRRKAASLGYRLEPVAA